MLPDPLLLKSDKFKVSMQDQQFGRRLGLKLQVWLAKSQLSGEGLREVTVLIKRKRKITTGVHEIREIASCLSLQSYHVPQPAGILRYLSYRTEPELELVFKLPSSSSQFRTMEDLIKADTNNGYAGHTPLDSRFRLAREVAEAVLSVHTFNRVHKNIRPDTILMIGGEGDGGDIGAPYLTK